MHCLVKECIEFIGLQDLSFRYKVGECRNKGIGAKQKEPGAQPCDITFFIQDAQANVVFSTRTTFQEWIKSDLSLLYISDNYNYYHF
jgi:hypothetical protein